MKRHAFFLLFILCHNLFFLTCTLFAQSSNHNIPGEVLNQDWRIHSLLKEGGLDNLYLMFVEFEEDGTAWIGSSNGLIEYNGYTWKTYTKGHGLPSSFVRCVLLTQNGLMWIGTDEGAGIFDGISYENMGSESGLSGQCVRRIREDSSGTVWFCCDRWPKTNDPGGLTSYKNGTWKIYTQEDGLPNDHIIDFFEDSHGRQFVLTLRGLAQRDGDRWFCPLKEENLEGSDDLFWSITESPVYGVLASTGNAVYALKDNHWARHASQYPRQFKLCQTTDGSVISCSDQGGKRHHFMEWEGTDFRPVSAGFKSPFREIGQIKEAPDGSIWCVGFDCLTRWQRRGSEWTEYVNVPPPKLVDSQGRAWFFDRKSTLRRDGDRWESIDNPHSAIATDIKGNVWGWSRHGITQWTEQGINHYTNDDTHLDTPVGFNIDAKGNIYFYGTDTQRRNLLSIFDGSSWTVHSPPEFQTGTIRGSTPDHQSGIWYLVETEDDDLFHLLHIDESLVKTIEVDSRVAPPYPTYLRVDFEGNIWLYGHFGLYRLNKERSDSWEAIDEYLGRNVTSSVLGSNEIWFGITSLMGGPGGLIRWKGGAFHFYPADPQELGVKLQDDTILFAGDECLYLISDRTNRIPTPIHVPGSGLISSIIQDGHKNIWISLRGSVLQYHNDQYPPDTKIVNAVSEQIENRNLIVSFQGIKRFQPAQINYPYLFSWKIDNENWGGFKILPEEGLSLTGINAGKHTLYVRAQDDGLDIDPTPASLEFTILPIPLQERGWFIPLAVILLLIVLSLALYSLITKEKLAYYARDLESVVQERTASLQERDATLQSIFRSAPVGIGHSANRIIRWTNNKLCEMTGYTNNELIGQHTRMLYPRDEDYNLVGENGYRAEKKPGIYTLETQWKRKNGELIDVHLNLTLIDPENPSMGVTFIALDITERKRAAKILEENERIFREAIEVAGAVPYYQNYQTDQYEYIGPGIQELIGYPQEEFTPTLWTSITLEMILLGNLQGLSEQQAVEKARGTEGVSWRADYRVRTKNGEIRWLANAAVQVRDNNNTIIGSMGILQDITDRKNLEEKLYQTQKIDAVGQLAGGIAHNINNLLTGIIGNQSLALLKASEDVQPYLSNANNAANRAAELVRELLAFSRKSTLELKSINLNQEIEDVYHLIRETFDRRIEIDVQTHENIPPVLADSSQIHSVLMNLCINARDALEKVMNDPKRLDRKKDTFTIILHTAIQEIGDESPHCERYTPPGKYAVISISDNGSGIDKETQRHIFEPFYTTKDTVGTGLGLASAFGIIQQHNGWIDYDTQPGRGTTFRVFLPIIEEDTQKDEYPEEPEVNLYGTETILLVDDEELILSLGEEILTDYGYTVLKARDGQECLDIYQTERERIGLIILDLSMPKLSGKAVMQEIRNSDSKTKIIISSGHSDGYDSDIMKDFGASGSISKPYKPDGLLRKIREVLDEMDESVL